LLVSHGMLSEHGWWQEHGNSASRTPKCPQGGA
jgi:hypothetical protein